VRILLVEDDAALASILEAGLSEHGYRVERASDFGEGRSRVSQGRFDVIVVDVMLPGGSGLNLCREIRKQPVATPILMLTAKDAIEDRVAGLESGADDYLVKPFAFQELVARLRALARRPAVLQAEMVRVADLEVNLGTRSVRRGSAAINLTAKEFALLEFFLRHRGQVVDRASISSYVWDENHDPFTNVLEVLVRRLRRKIDDQFEPKLIQTMRGAGYRFGA
jgi:two-component system copper resistance phosphate regulon response regulator CusR